MKIASLWIGSAVVSLLAWSGLRDAPPRRPLIREQTGTALRAKISTAAIKVRASAFPPETASLKGAFRAPAAVVKGAPSYAYEARVLEGIWAAAPYLHNGSVPTLAELLKPAAERVRSFKIGPAYDLVNVGLAVQQSKFDYTLETTDCSDRNSGNSRCGHEFGTSLTAEEKKALLEYLKTL
jgi:hypothetical protein